MQQTLIRYIRMLLLIPRHPRRVSAKELHERLTLLGYEITRRSVERDLNTLTLAFPVSGDKSKPQGWSWQVNANMLALPALDPQTALTLHMVRGHIEPLLPTSTIEQLKPWFDAAETALANYGDGVAKWPQKVRALPTGLPRISPTIDANVHAAVSEAVLQEKQLEVTYLAVGKKEAWTRTIHPLALVVRERVIYLIGAFDGHADVRQLALHRMQSATILDLPSVRPDDFDLDATIAKGEFGITLSKRTIKLEALFSTHVATYLLESPISTDQIIVDVDERDVKLTATVPDTFELRLWLKSFGDEVVVVRPAGLRKEFREIAANLHSYYCTE